MPKQPEKVNSYRLARIGNFIAIRWESSNGTPLATITLPVEKALQLARDLERRASNG